MRRAAWVSLLLLACNGEKDETPVEPPAWQPPPVEWTSVTVESQRLAGFTIAYPKGWEVKPIPTGAGLMFIAPEDDGFRPNFHVYWGTGPRRIEDWAREAENKYLQRGPGSSKALERKKTTVAGMEARLLIHTAEREMGSITWMSWFFADPRRGHGELKGVTRGVQMALGYRRIFEEMARRITYRAP